MFTVIAGSVNVTVCPIVPVIDTSGCVNDTATAGLTLSTQLIVAVYVIAVGVLLPASVVMFIVKFAPVAVLVPVKVLDVAPPAN